MTPLLIFNAVVLILATLLIIAKDNYILIIFWVPLAIFTIYWYHRFANRQPWLLSSQKVAMHGMDLYGDDDNRLTAQEIIDVEPIPRPNNQKLKKGKK
jgi:hypothetical protein